MFWKTVLRIRIRSDPGHPDPEKTPDPNPLSIKRTPIIIIFSLHKNYCTGGKCKKRSNPSTLFLCFNFFFTICNLLIFLCFKNANETSPDLIPRMYKVSRVLRSWFRVRNLHTIAENGTRVYGVKAPVRLKDLKSNPIIR